MDNKRKELIKELIESDKIYPVYQAILDKNNKLKKCEVLARIKYKEYIGPDEFITVAKNKKCYSFVTASIINKSFPYLSGLKDLEKFSINMNLMDIQDINIQELLKKSIIKYKVENKVIIELTEDEDLISKKEEVIQFMDEFIKEPYLCEFALDDFGKGYATFEPLIELNFQYIKLDAILTKNLTLDAKRYYLVDMLKHMSERLSLKLVAEHIGARPKDEEKEEELYSAVKSLNIDYLQGFYIHEPSDKLDLKSILLKFQQKLI